MEHYSTRTQEIKKLPPTHSPRPTRALPFFSIQPSGWPASVLHRADRPTSASRQPPSQKPRRCRSLGPPHRCHQNPLPHPSIWRSPCPFRPSKSPAASRRATPRPPPHALPRAPPAVRCAGHLPPCGSPKTSCYAPRWRPPTSTPPPPESRSSTTAPVPCQVQCGLRFQRPTPRPLLAAFDIVPCAPVCSSSVVVRRRPWCGLPRSRHVDF